MILSNRVLTFTKDKERIEERRKVTGSKSITIGSNVETTADATYLEITIRQFFTQTDWRTVESILFDYTREIYYTP